MESMAEEVEAAVDNVRRKEREKGRVLKTLALLVSIILLIVGAVGAPLLTRIYFLHGGARIWVTTFIQFAAFPIILPFIYGSYYRSQQTETRIIYLSAKMKAASVVLGLLGVFNSWVFAYGVMAVPVSTGTLLVATQIIFTGLFAFLLVRQKFTAFSVNAVVLLVIGIVLLGVQSSSDRPPGESTKKYLYGFFAMVACAVLLGLTFPLIQWVYIKFKQTPSLSTILEMQIIMSITGTVFCAVAMAINYDYRAISLEAEIYELGKTKYYLVLVGAAIFWQMMTIGYLGVIASSSALLAGVVLAMLVPVGEIMPVLLLGEKFTSAKGIATALCVWGFVSYLYGDYQNMRKNPVEPQDDDSE